MGWQAWELDPEKIPLFKLIFHVAQIVLGFVVWCLEIAVFKTDKVPINGQNGWTFAVFFISIPAWIYLGMAPRFPRTRKLAQPHAMVAVDASMAIIWLSAFSTQAAFNTAGSCMSVCGISKAIVGLGFFVFLFFCVTTFLSIYTLMYYKWNNRLPGYDNLHARNQNIDPDKAAFSLAPHDEEAYAPVNVNDRDDEHSQIGGGIGGHSDYDDTNTHLGGQVGGGGGRSDYSDPYGAPTASSLSVDPYRGHTPLSQMTPDPYRGQTPLSMNTARTPDPYRGATPLTDLSADSYNRGVTPSYLGSQTSRYGASSVAPSENPFRQDNPFDNDNDYQSSVGGGSRYAPPSVHDGDYEDEPSTRFPQAPYNRVGIERGHV
ncbi:hypothetical protein SMACR_06599 [Sordaria macrospora]|uniref:WGS project CABT00000000 data, contig 2.37 n=2 Tax=Sordaria macrospora TaxID=5147 RepID=F7W718_SORMK|nr:uncharacterized protein SMAC_06599 [Sordaria macrospora k-hell]KAA8634203.1 hypothetical protein SMACR_06599 [Sordaria macrospora]WPJ60047.1 hypothetical protein SMAC4_06599 [Sordaria macrospora]CCC13308.1 unnamed protein product [Sordaria macrospora k-hell]